MQKISILGCGWLGLPLGKHLATKGYVVKGSTTTAQKLRVLHQNKIAPFMVEVNRKIKGTNLPQFFQSDVLILNIPPGRKRRDVEKSHPRQVTAVLERAIQYGIKKILYVSSTSVYGNVGRMVTEADDPKPETNSGKALVQAENLLMHQELITCTILRMGGLVGPNRPAGRFLAGKKEVANGAAPVNMVHQVDCIAIISKIIEEGHWGEIFNVCADEHPSREAFYIHQAKKQGFEPPTFSDNGVISFKEVSNYKVKQALNYSFIYSSPMEF